MKQPPHWLLDARRQREEGARAAWSRIRAARPDYVSLRPPLELPAGPDLVLVVSHHPDGSGAVRITRFTPDGPLSHQVLADADAAIEHAIHHDRIDGEVVPGRVDAWSLTDWGARGIEALRGQRLQPHSGRELPMKHKCDDCEAEHALSALAPIEDLTERGWTPGWPAPSGQCPGCGGLCYPTRPVYVDPEAESLLREVGTTLSQAAPTADLHARVDHFLVQYRRDRRASLDWPTPELAEP